MTFVQPEFLVFFVLLFTAYWAVGRRVWQNLLLTLASMVFYGWVHPWFLYLLGFSAVLDYSTALGMVRWPRFRRGFLAASLAGNLGLLGFYKYFDFFVTNVAGALEVLGVHENVHTLGLFLPVGISFYTFQTLSYTIDVYRGILKPRRSFVDYATFIMMFPHLVAGPVVRAVDMLPQVESERTFDLARVRSGLTLALWGAAKKVLVADTVSLYVDRIFSVQEPSFMMIWAATLGFAVQILADFSGYTDIARGTARMLGFELTVNFKHPYLAASPSEFWRRWHVSFSSWIHDYLYRPLGGTDPGPRRRTAATYGSLLISGLWHGASWNFVLWGFYHATLLTAYRFVEPRIPAFARGRAWSRPLAVAVMFPLTCAGWLVFRETRLTRLLGYLTLRPGWGDADQIYAATIMFAVALAGALPLVLALLLEVYVLPRVRPEWRLPAQTTAWAVCAAAVLVFARDTARDFIYFQF
jgi:D-alanyl-lipoteichoic acid acyltransferase DltB (MBOAT superfamily)